MILVVLPAEQANPFNTRLLFAQQLRRERISQHVEFLLLRRRELRTLKLLLAAQTLQWR